MPHLEHAKGMVLYWFDKDKGGQSACAGDCLVKWPPYHRETVATGPGLAPEGFGVITRADGVRQTTFQGFPLCHFFQDKAPDEKKGDKFNSI